ncbi:regucalcin isoform X2 [Hippoglossus stenolepis]|uniref:regucalcin isoform X2 n=1 Tax=Hippoglossus stenolepis TaxID=195615 RepID=UPI00159C1AF0|nr:regucalcin isoform X2 [Hippoglossus stenolepis]
MSSVQVECVVKSSALIGEGPVWEESEQMLLFVDIAGKKIHRWSPTTNQIQSVDTGDTVSFAVPRKSGGYVAGVGRSIVAVDWSTQAMTSLVEVDEDKPNNRLNDGKVDVIGRLLAGTMGKEQRPAEVQRRQGALFSVTSDLSVTSHLSQEGEGLPDGMTVDAEGRLWVACYNGGRVINIDPATGVRLQTVSLPVMKITSCCFGGPDYSDLYVTSASLGLEQSESRQQPLAGHTFRVRGLGVKGRPSNAFSG